MALFELKQDTGSGAAAPWAPPTFKDCVAADIDAAFFEENEHADRHTVDGKDMLNPLTVVNLTFRAAQQVYDKTGGYDFKGLRVVEMGRVKKFKPGKIEKSEGMEATVTLELTYIMIEVDGEQLIEIDKLNGVYKVKGVDMLAKVRSLI